MLVFSAGEISNKALLIDPRGRRGDGPFAFLSAFSMSRESLDSFLSQLAQWTEQTIETGRTPFRKVEINPPLLHAPCTDLPHLVLWINRDSHMAGGLILLPDKSLEQALATGLALADALGLKNFSCWDRQQISVWGVVAAKAQLEKEIALPATPSAVQFRKHLQELLERLKILAVSNAPAKGEVTSYCLANLLRLALLDVAPGITEDLRTHQTKGPSQPDWPGGRDVGISKGLLTLFRLLAVGHGDLLPTTVVADGLERALRFSCGQLPDSLTAQLSFTSEEPGLSPTASARLHHVWRRLQQLGCLHRNSLLASSAELLQTDIESLTATPPGADSRVEGNSLLVNPGGVPGTQAPTAEVGLPAVLAWRSLLRWLRHQGHPPYQSSELDRLAVELRPDQVQASLEESPPPQRQQRAHLSTALRLAWPNRRFALSPAMPRWHYDLLQILGRAAENARLEIHLPSSWLDPERGRLIWDLICSDFALDQICFKASNRLVVKLCKSNRGSPSCCVEGLEVTREISWGVLRTRPLSYLQAILTWPEVLQRLIDQGLLQLREEHPCPEDLAAEEQRYWASRWGRCLAAWCGVDEDRLRKFDFRSAAAGLTYIPHPDRLRRLANLTGESDVEFDRHDQEIALWIGPELADNNWPEAPDPKRGVESSSRRSQSLLLEELESLVLTDGLPKFPTHYLYEHFRPRLESFDLRGPLQECGRFFDQISLQDQEKNVTQVDSAPLAACLILASTTHRGPIQLPAEPQVAADILHRYLADLQRLRHDLEQASHRLLEETSAARRLVGKAWKHWQLPEPDRMALAEALFPRTKDVQ